MSKKKIVFYLLVFASGFTVNYIFFQGDLFAALLGFGIGFILGAIFLFVMITKSLDLVKHIFPPKLF